MEYWLLLHSLPSIGPASFMKLLQKFGEPQKVFKASRQALMNIGINKNLVAEILSPPSVISINNILLELTRREFRMITLYDEAYPQSLKCIKNPPPLLYVHHVGAGFKPTPHTIAIIGASQASQEGLHKAFKLAYELAGSGFTIVSGYAKGIDTFAHLGAIKRGMKTIMVLPFGVLNFRVRKELYSVMDTLFAHSVILSESFPTASWSTAQALLRNRITSGLSDAIVVVEPGIKGGVISTVKWAKQENKPLFILAPVNTPKGIEILRMGALEVQSAHQIIEFMHSYQ